MAMFEPLLNVPERPLLVEMAPKPGQKRGRSQFEGAEGSEPSPVPTKRVRTGQAAKQWITVHNRADAMKQRYHYNVSTARLLVHVQKGWEDGLYLTSVASCDDLWAIVMDAGTDFTQQARSDSSVASFLQ